LARLQPAVQHLESHLREAPRVADLARLASLSESHFATLFKEVFHITPMGYYRRLRLQRAQQLLATTSTPLADIALQLGYTDQAHFTRSFTAAFGVSPAKHRQSQAGSEV
jgi:AraC family transcriptional regulator